MFVGYKRVLDHLFTRPHPFANYLDVKLDIPIAQLIEPSKDTGIYKISRAFSLATRMTSRNVITSSSDFSELPVISATFCIIIWIVFCCYLFLFVLDRKYYLYFYLKC